MGVDGGDVAGVVVWHRGVRLPQDHRFVERFRFRFPQIQRVLVHLQFVLELVAFGRERRQRRWSFRDNVDASGRNLEFLGFRGDGLTANSRRQLGFAILVFRDNELVHELLDARAIAARWSAGVHDAVVFVALRVLGEFGHVENMLRHTAHAFAGVHVHLERKNGLLLRGRVLEHRDSNIHVLRVVQNLADDTAKFAVGVGDHKVGLRHGACFVVAKVLLHALCALRVLLSWLLRMNVDDTFGLNTVLSVDCHRLLDERCDTVRVCFRPVVSCVLRTRKEHSDNLRHYATRESGDDGIR